MLSEAGTKARRARQSLESRSAGRRPSALLSGHDFSKKYRTWPSGIVRRYYQARRVNQTLIASVCATPVMRRASALAIKAPNLGISRLFTKIPDASVQRTLKGAKRVGDWNERGPLGVLALARKLLLIALVHIDALPLNAR
jgi:hypothetical protein